MEDADGVDTPAGLAGASWPAPSDGLCAVCECLSCDCADSVTATDEVAAAAAAQGAGSAMEKRKGKSWSHSRKSKAKKNNDKMHERNRYRERPPNFAKLAASRPALRAHLVGGGRRPTLNWKAPGASIELTKALLEEDFGLRWSMPEDRLCPTIPQKLNYLHWIEDLLALGGTQQSAFERGVDTESRDWVRGVDIGTGASCIYPLLGAAMHPNWTFDALELDPRSLACARDNVHANADLLLSSTNGPPGDGIEHSAAGTRVVAHQAAAGYDGRDEGGVLVGPWMDGLPAREWDFCMCNPPFFSSMDEAASKPSTACRGQEVEMVCPGGEVAFVGRIIYDSLQLRERFRWYHTPLILENSEGNRFKIPILFFARICMK